jgi:putative tryptophan/tyrosine transport system substrate-binding protein
MTVTIGRRELLAALGGAAAAWPLAARGQQPIPIIGSIYSVSAASWTDNMDAFRRGLAEVGFVDGRNVAIDYRWADGRIERMREFAADLIRRKVAVIVTGGAIAGVRDVVNATKTVPIVFTTAVDPVATGLVASLNRPGANVTGVTFIGSELVGKQLELLKELVPGAAKIAALVNPNNPVMAEGVIQNARTAARRLGLDVIVLHASTESEIDAAFTSAVEQRTSALFAQDAYFASRGEQIAVLGLRHRLPTVGVPQNVTSGILMGYGANIPDSYRQAGTYVGRILKGEKPGDLPVLQPTKFSLAINLKTAKALGIDVPLFLQQRADEVIE